MSEKEDFRIRKTKANLYKGILELMKKKTIEQIKINNTAKKPITLGTNKNNRYL